MTNFNRMTHWSFANYIIAQRKDFKPTDREIVEAMSRLGYTFTYTGNYTKTRPGIVDDQGREWAYNTKLLTSRLQSLPFERPLTTLDRDVESSDQNARLDDQGENIGLMDAEKAIQTGKYDKQHERYVREHGDQSFYRNDVVKRGIRETDERHTYDSHGHETDR